jgi:aspartyl-tRNA(Asn)/glutamyl-tRNA(Gln) amidotransferase subunit A
MNEAIAFQSLAEVSDRLRVREVSSEALTALMLQRAHQHNPEINCFIEIFDEVALHSARQLDRELESGNWRGPLHGVPIAVKDIFDFPGYSASAGSRLERSTSSAHATVLRKLADAGAVVIGTLNLDELAAGGTGDNAHFGRCCNPWNPAHNTGGSSGGSAAAVAAGLAYATLGSDAGGSIRLPAAFCGVVGLKPSYGRVSRHGAMARTWSMDCIGPLARSCSDASMVFNIIIGQDPLDASSVDSTSVKCEIPIDDKGKLPRLGLVDDSAIQLHRELDPNFDKALNLLKDAGYPFQLSSIPDLNLYTSLQQVLVKSEGAAMYEQALRNDDPHMSYAVRSVIKGGLEISAVRYIEALSLRRQLLKSFIEEVMGEVDLLIMPVSVPVAPEFTATDSLQASEVDRAFSDMATMTRFANYLGLPAISIPTGCDCNGLPTAIQLVARPFEESLLLSTAGHFESLCPALNYPGADV